jgi:hypothetical protein
MSLLELALWIVDIEECKPVQNKENQLDEESSPQRPRLDKSQLDGVDKAAESTVALMLSYQMCCLFWAKFVERTIVLQISL